jgi:hypothetical protein
VSAEKQPESSTGVAPGRLETLSCTVKARHPVLRMIERKRRRVQQGARLFGKLKNTKIMEKKSTEKLLAAGYVFLRKEDRGGSMGNEPKIKYSESFGTWRTLEIFFTKAERDRRFRELLDKPKYICDIS